MSIGMIKSDMESFLIKEGMYHGNIDFEKEAISFSDAMSKGLKNGGSSLKMIPAYIKPYSKFQYDKPIIVIDAGGTNFRRAVVTIKSSDVVIEDYKRYPMPGSSREISKEEFFETIIKYIEPILHRSDHIGFCFSYPVEILPNMDGKVITLDKEIFVKDIEQTILGEELANRLELLGYSNKKEVVVLNDTTAALLSGISKEYKRDEYMGLIIGTGTNISYGEKNSKICKDNNLRNTKGYTVVNLESGAYSKIPRGSADEAIDKKSNNPNEQWLEKMVSGAYQGILALETLKIAAQNALFSQKYSNAIYGQKDLLSKEISYFMDNVYNHNNKLSKILSIYGSKEDCIKTYFLNAMLIERAAKVIAIKVKGVLLESNQGENPCNPVCLTIDGSTFYGSSSFQSKFDYYLKEYMENKGFYIQRLKVENGILIGTAMGALIE